jgi:hypothetical protein
MPWRSAQLGVRLPPARQSYNPMCILMTCCTRLCSLGSPGAQLLWLWWSHLRVAGCQDHEGVHVAIQEAAGRAGGLSAGGGAEPCIATCKTEQPCVMSHPVHQQAWLAAADCFARRCADIDMHLLLFPPHSALWLMRVVRVSSVDVNSQAPKKTVNVVQHGTHPHSAPTPSG